MLKNGIIGHISFDIYHLSFRRESKGPRTKEHATSDYF